MGNQIQHVRASVLFGQKSQIAPNTVGLSMLVSLNVQYNGAHSRISRDCHAFDPPISPIVVQFLDENCIAERPQPT